MGSKLRLVKDEYPSQIGEPDFCWILNPTYQLWLLWQQARFKNGRAKAYCIERKVIDAKRFTTETELLKAFVQHRTDLLFRLSAGLTPPARWSNMNTDHKAHRNHFDSRT